MFDERKFTARVIRFEHDDRVFSAVASVDEFSGMGDLDVCATTFVSFGSLDVLDELTFAAIPIEAGYRYGRSSFVHAVDGLTVWVPCDVARLLSGETLNGGSVGESRRLLNDLVDQDLVDS